LRSFQPENLFASLMSSQQAPQLEFRGAVDASVST
jgi:hypothetical protein